MISLKDIRSSKTRIRGFALIGLTILATVSIVAYTLSHKPQDTNALSSGVNFKPGRIIDDAVFYNSSTLGFSNIQEFLNNKVPTCDTYGTGPSGYGNTRAQYAASKGWQGPPYTCMRNYSQNTPQVEAASGLCASISAKSGASAAQIISDISVACGVNPQVLLVLLEKEQSLVTDVWPLNSQFTKATGFACSDSAPCDPAYAGFFYQVYNAARQFKVYQKYPNNYNYIAGRTNRIYYQVNLGSYINPTGNESDPSRNGQATCGYSNIYIENQATAALYIYTPYQPNQKALANLYGTGDGCSAYGNRNFWRLFSDWFGSTLNIPGSCDAIAPDVTCVWELKKPNGDLFYTTSIVERDASIRNGFGYMRIAYYVRPTSSIATYPNVVPTYRLQNSGNHFWTSNTQLRQQYLSSGWSDEGVAWYTDPSSSNTGVPIYKIRGTDNKYLYVRFDELSLYLDRGYINVNEIIYTPVRHVSISPTNGTKQNVYRLRTCSNAYIYTTSMLELKAVLDDSCARYEGIAYYAANDGSNGAVAVGRYYNGGRYIWTTSQAEAASLTSNGWRYEGIAYYVKQ